MMSPPRRTLVLAVGLAAAIGVAPRPNAFRALAQGGPIKITAGEAKAPPGAPVALPITLDAPDSAIIGSVTMRIAFPKAKLTFVKFDPSGLALGVDAVIHAEIKKGATAASNVLEAVISTIEEGGSRKPIPAGPLAYISFTIAPDAKPETKITLTLQAVLQTTDAPAKAISGVVVSKAEVGVSTPPVSICFFYMH